MHTVADNLLALCVACTKISVPVFCTVCTDRIVVSTRKNVQFDLFVISFHLCYFPWNDR